MKLIHKRKNAESPRITRLFGKKKKTRVSYQNFGLYMAGTVGLEPTNGGVKVRCLTAWRRPSVNVGLQRKHYTIKERGCQGKVFIKQRK